MNKYEIAARLAAHGAKDGEINFFVGSSGDGGETPEAHLSALAKLKREQADFHEEEARPFEAVLREIEAEKPEEVAQPAEDAPCGFRSIAGDACERPRADSRHSCIEGCSALHPSLVCHSFQEPYTGPRYASGEEPMIGDVVSIRESADPYTFFGSAKVSEISPPFVYFGCAHDRVGISQCTLIRRADSPEEAKNEGVDREPVRSIHAAERLIEAAHRLSENLYWKNTREGYDYWKKVCDRLLEFAATAEGAKADYEKEIAP